MLGPGFFQNETLIELHPLTRLLFAGLWTIADREGRLEDRPKRIKMALLPADEHDIDAALTDLHHAGFIQRYATNSGNYIQITKFLKHQKPHVREAASEIPPPSTTKVGASHDLGLPKASLGEPDTTGHVEEGTPRWPVSVSVSNSVSNPVSVTGQAAVPAFVGKQRPMREYPRLSVFRWMVDDLIAMLGSEAEAFDLDAYLIQLDQSGEPLPASIWPWLKDRVSADFNAARHAVRESEKPHVDYDQWRQQCRDMHDGACGNYNTHLVKVQMGKTA